MPQVCRDCAEEGEGNAMTYKQRCEQWAKAGGHRIVFSDGPQRSRWGHVSVHLFYRNCWHPLVMPGLDEEDACHRLWDLLVDMGLTTDERG